MRLLSFTFILCSLVSMPAWACRCMAPNDELAINAYSEADIVIYAEIINPSKGFAQSGPMVSVKVTDVIKGRDVPENMNLNYNNVTAACGNYYETGQKVLIGIYDNHSVSANQSTRGYGYRVMSSCQQAYIQHYVDNPNTIELNQNKTE